MARVVMYTTQICPYCVQAKRLLNRKGIVFEEIDVSRDPELRRTMIQKAGGRLTVPQIFVGATHVGGYHELYELDEAGSLAPLLAR